MPRRKPTSNVGAAMTRQIAAQHGLAGDVPVVRGVESPEEVRRHHDDIVARLDPEGPMEFELASRIARITWRLRRADRYEAESITVARERTEFDFARERAWGDRPSSVDEANERAEKAKRIVLMVESLMKVPPETALPREDVDAFLEALAEHAGTGLDDFLSDIDCGDDDGPWTAAELSAALQAIGRRDGKDALEDGMLTFVERARALAFGAERVVAQTREDIDRMYRERLLPGAPVLELLIRYESAYNRMLYQAINQLEAMQASRKGTPVAPPFRLQHYGGRNG